MAWERDPILKFWDPLNISQTGKATIFKFGMHIGRGQFLPPGHKLAPKWAWPGVRNPISKFWDRPSIFRKRKKLRSSNLARTGGGILWRPPSRTACYCCNTSKTISLLTSQCSPNAHRDKPPPPAAVCVARDRQTDRQTNRRPAPSRYDSSLTNTGKCDYYYQPNYSLYMN